MEVILFLTHRRIKTVQRLSASRRHSGYQNLWEIDPITDLGFSNRTTNIPAVILANCIWNAEDKLSPAQQTGILSMIFCIHLEQQRKVFNERIICIILNAILNTL